MKLRPIKPLESRSPIAVPKWIPREEIVGFYEQYKPAVAAAGVALAVMILFIVLYMRHASDVATRSSQIYREALSVYNYRIPPKDSDVTPLVASDEEKYVKAQAMFQQIHETYPGSKLAPEALYYVGNCRFRLKQYSPALEAFELFISRYPRNAFIDAATLGKGDCMEQLSRYQEAYTAYKSVLDRGGPLSFAGALGATRCLLKLTESDPTRWSEASDILNKLATGKSESGAREARELRKLLTDLMPKKGESAQPRPRPAPQAATGVSSAAPAAAQPSAAPANATAATPQPAPAGGAPAAKPATP